MFEVRDCSLEPNKTIMSVRFILYGIQFFMGLFSFIYTGSWSLFIIWLAAILLFLTVPRKLICARCEGYGKKCYSMYLGLYTSKLFSYEKKDFSMLGAALEAASISGMLVLPAYSFNRNLISLLSL